MKKSSLPIIPRSAFALGLALILWSIIPPGAHAGSGVPTLDEMAADWMPASTVRAWPATSNFHGAIKTNPNVLAFTHLAFPPYSQAGRCLDLSLNGALINASKVRWFPYQVVRQATVGGLEVETTVRLVFENDGGLFRIVIKNTGTQSQQVSASVDLQGFNRRFDGAWGWDIPRPGGAEGYQCTIEDLGKYCVVRDGHSVACTAFAFNTPPTTLQSTGDRGRATWSVTIPAGGTRTVDFAMAIGDKADTVIAQTKDWAQNFDAQFDGVKKLWEKRWHDAFTPNNGHFSGYAPILTTTDEKLRREYYMGVLVPLLMERTNLPMAPRAYVTASPQWAVTLEYMWDTALWSGLFARLDPAMLKAHLEGYLTLDYEHCNARCMLSGKPAGPWYSANDLSLFTMFWDYLTITGDWGILKDSVGGKTVLDHMDFIVTHWKSLVRPNTTLADYGGAGNLLECVPTYINQVPSLNAANVCMMRRMAEVHDRLGDKAKAEQYRADAANLEAEVLKLYIPGQGVWNCIHNDGKMVELRHCYDYITIGQSLQNDLTSQIKTEMTAFVEKELLVPGWMRAQSLSDPSAAASDRPDHGPKGAYDAWPALTAATMCDFGQYDKALNFLHDCEGVTHEGPFSQAHELLPTNDADHFLVRIANRGYQDDNEICGAAFASESILRGLFGCEPRLADGPLMPNAPSTPRGFQGTLTGVRYRGAVYTVKSSDHGVTVTATRP